LKQSGQYQHTVIVESGLDSLITLDLTIGMGYQAIDKVSIPADSTYTFEGQIYDATGIYTAEYTTVLGCDSIIQLDLTVTDGDTVTISKVAEGCDVINFRGQLIDATGIYADTVVTASTDTIYTLGYTLWPSFDSLLEKKIALGKSFLFEGQTFAETGVYSVEYTTEHGCDSILTLDLSVIEKTVEIIDSIYSACGSFTYGDSTFTKSAVLDTLFNRTEFADTIITASIEIWPVYDETVMVEILDGNTYPFAGEAYAVAGEYPHLFTTGQGCDSTVTLNLSVTGIEPDKDSIRSDIEFTVCALNRDSIGIYYDTIVTDTSIVLVEYRYSYDPVVAEAEDVKIMPGESYTFMGHELTEPGMYSDTVFATEEDKCDIIYSLSLIVESPQKEVVNIDSSATACDSFIYNGTEYTESISIRDSIFSPEGNDTIFVFNLTILNSHSAEQFDTITVGQFMVFGNDTVGISQDYTDAYVSEHGCDSIILHHITAIVPEGAVVAEPGTETTISIDETAEAGTVIALLPYTDNEGNVLEYSLSDTDNFAIVDGAIVLSESAVIDYETAQEIALGITINNGTETESATINIPINNMNDNEPVIAVQTEDAVLAEGALNGAVITAVSASDLDDDALTYSIVSVVANALKEDSNTDGIFAINSATGEITVADASLIDFTNISYTITVAVTDGVHTETTEVVVVLQATITDSKESVAVVVLELYPTIASETITVSAPVIGQLSIISINGTAVSHGVPFAETATLSIDGLPSGAYIIRIETDNSVFEEPFFIR